MTTANPPAAFAGFDDFIEVFRSGTHTSSTGEQRTWTDAELDQMVANHNPEHPAPAVLGHPEADHPAYAWVQSLKRVGSTLLAKFTDVAPEFDAAVRAKKFRNRSVKILSTEKGFAIGHVGFLGAALPAVSGLKPIEFSTLSGSSYEFALPQQEPPVSDKSFTQADIDAAVAKANAASAITAADAEAKSKALLAELNAAKFAQRLAECHTVVASFAQRGQDVHLTPAQTEGLAEFRAQLLDTSVQEFSFTAADKSTKKQSLVACFDALLKGLPVQMKLGQKKADGSNAPEGSGTYSAEALADKALEFQAAQAKKGVELSIAHCVAHVSEAQ